MVSAVKNRVMPMYRQSVSLLSIRIAASEWVVAGEVHIVTAPTNATNTLQMELNQ